MEVTLVGVSVGLGESDTDGVSAGAAEGELPAPHPAASRPRMITSHSRRTPLTLAPRGGGDRRTGVGPGA